MFNKKKENKIINLELDFQTDDPYVNYLKYKNCFYFIKESKTVFIDNRKWDDKLNAMIAEPRFQIYVEKAIKIEEEYTPLIEKQLYYEIKCPEPYAVIKNLKKGI